MSIGVPDPESAALVRRVARMVALVVAGFGVVVLVALLLNAGRVIGVPGVGADAGTTLAVTLVAVAALLAQIETPGPRARLVGSGLAALVVLVAIAGVVADVTGWRLGVDQLIEGWGPAGGRGVSGAPAPQADVALALCGVALLAAVRGGRRGRRWAEGLGVLVAALGLVGLLSHTAGAQDVYRPGGAHPLSVPATLMFVGVGMALMLGRGEGPIMARYLMRSAGGVLLRWALPLILLVPVVLGAAERAAERAGLDHSSGLWLFSVIAVGLYVVLLWRVAGLLDQIDEKREERACAAQAAGRRAVVAREQALQARDGLRTVAAIVESSPRRSSAYRRRARSCRGIPAPRPCTAISPTRRSAATRRTCSPGIPGSADR